MKLILVKQLWSRRKEGPQWFMLMTVRILMPHEGVLAEKMCDFIKELWVDEPL